MRRPNDPPRRCRPTSPQPDLRGIDALDPILLCVLTLARYHFQSLAQPQSEGWTLALPHADRLFGRDAAPGLVCAVQRMVQQMRCARVSVFRFSNPTCRGCAARLTGHERLLLSSLRAMMADRPADAEAHAMILCEGNDTDAFLAELSALSRVLAQT